MHRIAPLLLGLALVVAACGSGSGSDDTSTTPPPASDTSPTSTAPPTSTSATATTDAPTTTGSSTTTAPNVTEGTIEVFFSVGDGSDCAEVAGFERQIASGLDPLLVALQLLVAGPTPEEGAAGAGSFFSSATADAVRTVALIEGSLVVDFRDVRAVMNNASTSCGSEALLAQLNSTVFQFSEVERVRFEIDGSCDIFSNWLQRECEHYTRDGATPAPVDLNDRALGSGCAPGDGQLPDGRWFGYVSAADSSALTFDLACFFVGSAAAEAATEDGEESPPPNDYYVRNASDLLRAVAVSPATTATWFPTGDPADVLTAAYEQWVESRTAWPEEVLPGVWLDVTDGKVVAVEEQYVP